MIQKTIKSSLTKRKFIRLGVLGIISSVIGWKFFSWSSSGATEKIKMLTPDGKLVEIDKEKIKLTPGKKPVSNAEIKKWMRFKS